MFPGVTIPSTTGIYKCITEVGSTGSLLNKKLLKSVLTTEKVGKIVVILEYKQQPVQCLAQNHQQQKLKLWPYNI